MRNMVSVAVLLLGLPLAGCVYADADFVESAGQVSAIPNHAVSPEKVELLSGDVTDRPYRVIGDLSASAFALSLFASDPVPADVEQLLREKAASRGADAVLFVQYQVGRQGLRARGRLSMTGKAVQFL